MRALAHRRTAYATIGDDRLRVLEARAVGSQGQDAVPVPGTVSKTREGVTVACAEGALLLLTVQLSRGSGRPMPARDAANGYPRIFAAGARFDVPR